MTEGASGLLVFFLAFDNPCVIASQDFRNPKIDDHVQSDGADEFLWRKQRCGGHLDVKVLFQFAPPNNPEEYTPVLLQRHQHSSMVVTYTED